MERRRREVEGEVWRENNKGVDNRKYFKER